MGTLNIGKVRGNMWYVGDGITGSSTTPTVYSGSGVTKAYVGDMYLHLESGDDDNGHVYQCTLKGDASTAKWVYVGSILGPMPELCDELTSTSITKAATANVARKLKGLIDSAGIYPVEVDFNYTDTDYSMTLSIENISTTITITDSDGNEGTYSYTKSGTTDDVALNINIGEDIGYASEGAVVVKVVSSSAAIKNAKLYGDDGLVCDITPNMWEAVNELSAEIKPGATITGGSGDDAYSYRAGSISKKIAGVITSLFPVTHAKAVWMDKVNGKTVHNEITSLKGDMTPNILTGSTNTTGSTLTTGTYFINSTGQLCKATSDIAANGTITLNTNCVAVSAGEELTALNSNTTPVRLSNYSVDSNLDNQLSVYKLGSIVFIEGIIFSQTSSEVSFTNGQTIISGLPKASRHIQFEITTFHSGATWSQHRAIIQQNTGIIEPYYDTVTVCNNQGSTYIRVMYVTSE